MHYTPHNFIYYACFSRTIALKLNYCRYYWKVYFAVMSFLRLDSSVNAADVLNKNYLSGELPQAICILLNYSIYARQKDFAGRDLLSPFSLINWVRDDICEGFSINRGIIGGTASCVHLTFNSVPEFISFSLYLKL